MILESFISKEKGLITNEEYQEIKYIINDIFERIEFDENDINQIIELLIYDKKKMNLEKFNLPYLMVLVKLK